MTFTLIDGVLVALVTLLAAAACVVMGAWSPSWPVRAGLWVLTAGLVGLAAYLTVAWMAAARIGFTHHG